MGLAQAVDEEGDIRQYHKSHAAARLLDPQSMIIGAVVPFMLLRVPPQALGISVGVSLIPWVSVIFYETYLYPTSHNLLGIEVIVLLVIMALVHLPAAAVKWIAWRIRRSNAGSPPQ